MSRTARALFAGGSALVLVTLRSPCRAAAFPAFAREYGLRCTACHEAWPALNDFGCAFRNNGYQQLQGMDKPTTTAPSYIPFTIRITPHYELDTTTLQQTDQGSKTLQSGGISDIGLDLLPAARFSTMSRSSSFRRVSRPKRA